MNTYHNKIPSWYKCSKCGKHGVKLWRFYCSLPVELHCQKCAEKDQGKLLSDRHEIGWFVPAVPDMLDENITIAYWGFTSIPKDVANWWKSLRS